MKLKRSDLRKLITEVIEQINEGDPFDELEAEMGDYEKNKKSIQQDKSASAKEKQKSKQDATKKFTGKLTADQANNPDVVGKFIAQYESEIKGADAFDEMDISMKYGLVQRSNDVYVFELADGSRIMFTKTGQKKKEVK